MKIIQIAVDGDEWSKYVLGLGNDGSIWVGNWYKEDLSWKKLTSPTDKEDPNSVVSILTKKQPPKAQCNKYGVLGGVCCP